MFIDEIDHKTCWKLWTQIHFSPVKTARKLFPMRPPLYVSVTKSIGGYLANKGTALGLPGKDRKRRRDMYIGIAAGIYTRIPQWGRSINIDFLNEEN